MLNITKKFRKALFNDRRQYLELLTVTLSDGTVLNLTNDDLMEGIGFEDMVSEDDNFQIGGAIVNTASVKLNNMYDDFTDYNFDKAKVYANVGIDFGDGTSEVIRKFTAYVDEAKYNGSVIDLVCTDYMGLFDQQFDDQLGFPATLGTIVQYCCTRCNVTLGTVTFPRSDYQVAEKPDFGETTYRQILAWVAQFCCCFARCNVYGELEIKWYGIDALNAEADRLDGGQFDSGTPKYQTGDHADGGGFMTDGDDFDGGDFNTASAVHTLNGIFSCEVCKDPITITGVSVTSTEYDEDVVSGTETTTERKTYTAMSGTTGYVIAISGNPLVASPTAATETAAYLAAILVGFTFWTATVSHLNDPSIEAGDVMLFSDYKGVTYRGIVSSTSFRCGELQTTNSSAETPAARSKKQLSNADTVNQAILDLENWLLREKSAYEIGIDDLSNRLAAKSGLYTTKETVTGGGDIWYLHDKPELNESTKVIKITSDAIGFSTDGGQTWNSGLMIDGQMVATKLSAVGVSANWMTTGRIADKTNTNYWDLDTGAFRLGDPQSANANLVVDSDLDDFVTECVVEFCKTTTSTEPSATDSGWGTTVSWEKGKYLWSHVKTTYKDGTVTRTSAEKVAGPDGVGVSSVETMWIQTTSNTTAPATNNGSWSTTQPSWVYGRYIWTMTKTTFSDGSVDYSTPVLANALNEDAETVFNKLTDNGVSQGIYRALDSATNKYKLYVNATYMKTGILASNDTNQNFRLDLSTGQMTMKKGSINLGYDSSSNTYNFTVNDNGQVAIKSGSISLGSSTGTYYFNVSTSGAMQWKSQNSSMSSSGSLTCTGADISGTIKTVSGDYETKLDSGWIYFRYNGSNFGKIGSALVSGIGNMFNLNMMSGANGFGIYDGDGASASELLTYTRRNGYWDFARDLYCKGYKVYTEDDFSLGVSDTVNITGIGGNYVTFAITDGIITNISYY